MVGRESVGAGEIQRPCLIDGPPRFLWQQHAIPHICVHDRAHPSHVAIVAAVPLAKLGWREVDVVSGRTAESRTIADAGVRGYRGIACRSTDAAEYLAVGITHIARRFLVVHNEPGRICGCGTTGD